MPQLATLLPDLCLQPDVARLHIERICYDSRNVGPHSAFVAWQGGRFDGHQFIAQAIDKGACVVLCEIPQPDLTVPHIVVDDARATLAQMAACFYGHPSQHMRMIGVTGTNGKTSVAHMIEAMLWACNFNAGIIGTLGFRFKPPTIPEATSADLGASTGLTTPNPVDLQALLAAMVRAQVHAVAMEVSSQALVQSRVAGIAFDVGVFTNLTHDHLDYHGSVDAYFQAKARLFSEHLKPNGRGVFNADDARVRTLARSQDLLFSTQVKSAQDGVDIYVKESLLTHTGMQLVVQTPRDVMRIQSPLLGTFNVSNLLAAIGVGEALDLPLNHMAAGLGALAAVPGRLQKVNAPDEPLVVVDYAHTPDALRQALATMRSLTVGRLLCVFGCGGDRDASKRPEMGRAAYHGADWSVITQDNPRTEDPQAINAAIAGGMQAAGAHMADEISKGGYCILRDRATAIHHAVMQMQPDDVLLIAGKGHETYQLIGSTSHNFDDRVQARHALDFWRQNVSNKESNS